MSPITAPDGFRFAATRPARSRFAAVLMGLDERRHVASLMSFYAAEGIDVVYLDDGSTDGTVDLVADHIGAPVIAVLVSEPSDDFSMVRNLTAKEVVMRCLPHRWVMHADMDEYRRGIDGGPLLEAVSEAEKRGANALNFQEYTFIPTAEEPDHDHPEYRATMHWYYPFSPRQHHRVNAFIPEELPDFDLVSGAGHRVRSDHLTLFEHDLTMDHYPFLGLDHFRASYGDRRFSEEDHERGWHKNRIDLRTPRLPHASRLRDIRQDGYRTEPAEPRHLWTFSADGEPV